MNVWWIVSIFGGLVLTLLWFVFNENLKELLKQWEWNTLLVRWWAKLLCKVQRQNLRDWWWLWLCAGFLLGSSSGVALTLWLATPIASKSTFLALDDGQKWRFSEALRKAAVAENGERINCEFVLGLSRPLQQFVWGVWTELEPMLDLSGWRHAPSGDLGLSQLQFPAGFTILAGADKGPAFNCAAALGRALQDTLASGTPVTVRPNQVTEALSGCKNKCVELDIGAFLVR